ncbi:histone-lysine N-methyltransferase SETMAR [Elysia marginata]|uniref:Histone-lysine N-methyltransferase SETMAR n=1 Tax=Elysia marginata TaxID=1093978 RepID=A0AAV4I959_9GAST|nr:histone-lysine N-methyltransferase SETMAR [Elysia marginata]
MQGWLEKYGWEILPHPPHSPDLAPSDYHLFGPLKRELARKRFDDDEELVDHVRKWLQNLDGSFFREGIYSMHKKRGFHWHFSVNYERALVAVVVVVVVEVVAIAVAVAAAYKHQEQ